jgi:hypothetical protein
MIASVRQQTCEWCGVFRRVLGWYGETLFWCESCDGADGLWIQEAAAPCSTALAAFLAGQGPIPKER